MTHASTRRTREICGLLAIGLASVGWARDRRDDHQHEAPIRFVQVVAGADHACALTTRGVVYCWGSNRVGQLGIGAADSLPHAVPRRVAGDITFTVLASGFDHTCGMVSGGAAYCWGANESGQLGDGSLTNRPLPVRVKTDVAFRTIGPGGTHTCAVSAEGAGYCWGGNWHGQIGEGSRSGDTPCCHLTPVRVRTTLRFRSVVAGGIHSCGIAVDSMAYCWGSPQQGRLGSGADDARDKTADKVLPRPVTGAEAFATVSPRGWHTCGLTSKGAALCWGGAGSHGVLGTGEMSDTDASSPRRVSPPIAFATLVTGHMHNCALTPDGVAYCWGANSDGELGDGTTRDEAAPRRVATDRRFVSIAAGGNAYVEANGTARTWGFTCGVAAASSIILCWGDNRHGELGNGSADHALTPVLVDVPHDGAPSTPANHENTR